MLPLSRPLSDQQAASRLTLAVVTALSAATLIVLAALTG